MHLECLEGRLVFSAPFTGSGTGLIANYFTDPELKNLALTRIDPTVDFNWGTGSPDPSIPVNGFSARWSGKVQAQYSETYTFYTNSDEGVALWVNGQQIIDDFTDHTLTEDSGTITLTAGETYNIRVDYYENAFDAQMQLSWSSDSTPKQIIPTSQLYPDSGWTGGAWLNTDVGSPDLVGSVSSVKQTYTLTGGGNGLSNGSDQFQYLYQSLDLDGTVVAQVSSQDAGGQAGIMLRDNLGGASPFAALTTSSSGAPQFFSRSSPGGNLTTASIGASSDYWLKLVRDGNFIRGYASSSGADGSWTYVGAQNISADHTVYVGTFSTSDGTGGLDHATFKSIAVNAVVPLGAGLDAVRDFSFGNIFVDAAKQARTPQGPNLGPAINFDAQGNPANDFMTIFVSGFVNQAHLYNGTYHGSFTGQADLNTWLTPGGQIQNKIYDPNTNTTTFDLIVNASETQDGWYIGMNFLNTRRDPNGATNTGITNLKLIRPGYDPNTTQLFQNSYLDHLKQFSVLRLMDWTQTNNSTIVNWSDRTLPTDARQSSTKGVAWEYVVQLANMLHKDVWINVPAKATDDYVTQLASFLKNNLDPDRVVYVEYSNEVWNGIFSQFADNQNAAIAEVNAGNSPLNADGETNTVYWAWRRVANRLKQISDIFGNVWGPSAINARVRPVLSGQHANPLVLQEGLELIERTYGPPGKFFYGVANAPYFGASSLDSNSSATVDQYISGWSNSIANQKYFNAATLAARYGLANMSYEGGPDTFGPNNIATKHNASLDPRMRTLVNNYLNGWYNQGGGLFMWFVSGPTNWNTSNGTWGLTDSIENLNSPKLLGTVDVASEQRQPLSYGNAVPGSFDARAIAGATFPYGTTYRANPTKGNSIDYFVRVPAAGKYQISFNGATAGSNEQIRVAVNGTDVRTITLANTGGATANFTDNLVGTFTLPEGMNLIHLTAVAVTSWNLQTVTIAPAATTPNGAPSVVNPAAAASTSINGTTTNLSVLGDDDGGESNLRYSWEAVNQQPTDVTFSANGTNGAKATTVTFTRAGTYELRVTISDGLASTTSSVFVTVNQVATTVSVTPSGSAIANGETKQLTATAKDQFGIALANQPVFTWQVDNGFGTVSQSGLYQSPASGLGTATVRAITGGISGTTTVQTQSPTPADTVNFPLPGIEYSYYQQTFSTVPNFDTLTPTSTGLLNNFSLSPAQRTTNYAIQYTGYVYAPAAATYTFYTSSDDGSKLWVGGSLVVNNDGLHSAQERSGSLILDQGWHAIKVGYIQGTGNASLTVSYSSPSLAKQAIPDGSLERADRAPTVATPAAASPNPVSGTTANLSVVGADESGEGALTYNWSAVTLPAGAAQPSFSLNNSNGAKNTTATFFKAGTYTLQVGISDGTITTNTQMLVSVNATVTSLSVSPTSASLRQGQTQQFTASAVDQFGNVINNPPPFTWSAPPNGGSIDSTGLYTAPPDLTGNFNITATIGNISGGASANVTADLAPTVVTPASASPSTINPGDSSSLSVLGGDADDGEGALTYTWAATSIPAGATLPSFNINGSNAAKNATAMFTQSGPYTLTVTISDGFKSTTSSVGVTVLGQQQSGPYVVTPAAATPSPVTGATTNLSVLGGNAGGSEASLIYTWATLGTPPADVSFSKNATNDAKNTVATFTKAGSYTFVVDIYNGQSSATGSVTVNVNATLTNITLSPASVSLNQGATQQFTPTARDQFANIIANPGTYAWSVTSTGTAGTISQAGLYTAPSSGTPTDTVRATIGSVQGTASVTVTQVVPQDIFGQSQDIGGPSILGSYSFSNGTYTVNASGADIYSTADQFHFVYKTLTGDGQIVARVASVQNTNLRAKAAVMFRDTLDGGSKNVNLNIAPDHTATWESRTSTNGTTAITNVGSSGAPYWVKIVRSSNTFTGYRSPDGVTWTQIGNPVTYTTFAATAYVGLALTSHDNTKLNTSTFTNVSVTAAGSLAGMAISAQPASLSTGASNLIDGNTATYYQSSTTSDAWAGLDLGAAHTITSIKFAPRSGSAYAAQMIGGKFQASDTADFSGSVVDLYTIKAAPKTTGLTTVHLKPAPRAFRYVRYLAPAGSAGNVAEVTFVGV